MPIATRYRSVVCLSVCLSHSCIMIKRQKISTRFLLHMTACLCQIVLKFGLYQSTTSTQNFASHWPTSWFP